MIDIIKDTNPVVKHDYSIYKRLLRVILSIVYALWFWGICMLTHQQILGLQGKEVEFDSPLIIYFMFLGIFALTTYLHLRFMLSKNWRSMSGVKNTYTHMQLIAAVEHEEFKPTSKKFIFESEKWLKIDDGTIPKSYIYIPKNFVIGVSPFHSAVEGVAPFYNLKLALINGNTVSFSTGKTEADDPVFDLFRSIMPHTEISTLIPSWIYERGVRKKLKADMREYLAAGGKVEPLVDEWSDYAQARKNEFLEWKKARVNELKEIWKDEVDEWPEF